MFELFILTILSAISLSQLLPETKQNNSHKTREQKRARADQGIKKTCRVGNVFRLSTRHQTQTSRALPNSTEEIGLLNRKPCIW